MRQWLVIDGDEEVAALSTSLRVQPNSYDFSDDPKNKGRERIRGFIESHSFEFGAEGGT